LSATEQTFDQVVTAIDQQDLFELDWYFLVEMIMGMGFPWERMGITLYGNGNGRYSHGNKFPSAHAMFSLCNSNVQH